MKLLPKVSKKFLLIILICLFSLVSPISAAASSLNQAASPTNGQPTTPSYKIVPIPPATSSSQITPIPTPNQNPNIQLAVGTPWGWLGDRVGDILGLFKEATLKLVEAAFFIVQHAALIQIAGDMIGRIDDLLGAAASGDRAQIYQTVNEVAANPDSLGNAGMMGLAQQTTNGILALDVPVSSAQYFASINPFAQAQAETGEKTIAGSGVILGIWKKVRDASFALAVVILIIIGFMIMFRVPINPRAVVTAQNALPRIVIALLLIFFSFAIAGLMVDITRLIASFLDNLVTIPLSAKAGIPMLFFVTISMIVIAWATISAATGFSMSVVFAVVILGLCLLLSIAILAVFFNLIFKLLTRYVIFLLLTMFAPIFFLFGALPGAEGLMINWFRRAAAALLAIPLTGLVLNLSFAIGFSGFGTIEPGQFDIPPLNLFGGVLNQVFGWFFLAPLVGLGLFFFSTKVPDIVDEALGNRPLGARAGFGLGAVFLGPPKTLASAGKSLGGIEKIGQWYGARGWPGSGAATNLFPNPHRVTKP